MNISYCFLFNPFSLQGECEVNPKYMKMKCGPACQSCDYKDIRNRCKIEDNGPDAWSPGDLDKMFRRLATEEPFVSQYGVQVLSSPDMNDGPWVVTLENVVSQEEADKLIDLGKQRGYERSTNVGKLKADGTFESVVGADRTSSNTWCQDDCYKEEVAVNVTNRIVDMVQIPEKNSEYLQMLQYEPGQL